jgi:hypothetical protein
MGAVAEGQNYQDYMISHRWEHEVEQPQVTSTNFAETFAAETEPSIGERVTAAFMGISNMVSSQPLLVVVGLVGVYFLHKGLRSE